MDGNIVVVVIPLQQYFGLVTYDKNDGNYFTFREKYAINIFNLNRDYKISTISRYFPSEITVVGRCLYPKIILHSVFVVINTFRITESAYFPGRSCIFSLASEFVFFMSERFPKGVTVFIDNGHVRFQRYSEGCEPFGEINVCTDVLRFASVTNGIQAIYCENTTYLLDIVTPLYFELSKGKNTDFSSFAPNLPITLTIKVEIFYMNRPKMNALQFVAGFHSIKAMWFGVTVSIMHL